MFIEEHFKNGITKRELSKEEINFYASKGSLDAKKEILKEEIINAKSIQEELNAIKKFLGV
jgi:hypothetical protein